MHVIYKAAIQGAKHKRIPNDVARNPIISDMNVWKILEVGRKLRTDIRKDSLLQCRLILTILLIYMQLLVIHSDTQAVLYRI
jgi:hypothetical protein